MRSMFLQGSNNGILAMIRQAQNRFGEEQCIDPKWESEAILKIQITRLRGEGM